MSRFSLIGEPDLEDVDYFDLPDLPEGESDFSELQSQASSVSQPFFRRDVNSPATSVYSQPVSSTGQPSSRYEQPAQRKRLRQFGEPPRDDKSILASLAKGPNSFISLVLNSLTKEIINVKFLVEEISFGQLSKIQKEKLKQIIVRINKVKGFIRTGISKPIYINLNSVINLIEQGLSSEGQASEFLLRTEAEMPPEQVGEIEGLAGSGRKRRMLSPAMFNAHNYDPYNVNCNFAYSLARRNV